MLKFTATFVLFTILFVGIAYPSYAESPGTVRIITTDGAGKVFSGVPFVCKDTDPSGKVSQATLVSDAQGLIIWKMSVQEGHTYSCAIGNSDPYDCYSADKIDMPQPLTLKQGDMRQFTQILKYNAQKCQPKTQTQVQLPQPPVNQGRTNVSVTGVVLPQNFKANLDFNNVNSTNASSIKGFVLESEEIGNKIEWLEPLDFSGEGLGEKFKNLDQYVNLDHGGLVEIDSNNLPIFNKKAKVTLTQLNLNVTEGRMPILLKDGALPKEGEISNVSYANNSLSFVVSSFSKYTIKPTLSVTPCEFNQADVCLLKGSVDDYNSIVTLRVETSKNYFSDENIHLNLDGSFEKQIVGRAGEDSKVDIIVKGVSGELERSTLVIKDKNTSQAAKEKNKFLVISGIVIWIVLSLMAIFFVNLRRYHINLKRLQNK